jgi:hypothetical protein
LVAGLLVAVGDVSLGLVRVVAARVGRVPTTVEYDAARAGLVEGSRDVGVVGASALSRRYGGWSGVLEAAMLVPDGGCSGVRVSGRLVRRYPDARLVESLVACWRWLGYRPSVAEYRRWRSTVVAGSRGSRALGVDVPAPSTIQLRFGSWVRAVESAWPEVVAGGS